MASSRGMMILALAIGATLFHSNEAVRATSSVSLRMQMRTKAAAQRQAAMAAMPMDKALDIFSHRNQTSPTLVSLVQEKISRVEISGNLRKGVPQPDEGADYGTGTKNAVVKINEMLLETIKKMDEEELRCEARFEEIEQLLTEIAEDMVTFQTAGSEAAANKLDAYGQIQDYAVFISQTQTELTNHYQTCDHEKDDLHRQLAIVISDQGVMEKILNMTQCSDTSYSKAGATLLQCTDKSGAKFTRIEARQDLAAELAKLQHPKSRSLVSGNIVTSETDLNTDSSDDNGMVLLEQGHRHRRLRKMHHHSKHQHRHTRRHHAKRVVPQGLYGAMNASDSVASYPDQPDKCSISNSSHCPELRERFLNIAGGISDAREELELMIGNLQTRCLEIEGAINREIAHFEIFLRQQQTKEGQASADFGASQASTQKKQIEQREASKSLEDERAHCTTVEKELKNEECALNKIRDQLLNMSKLERHIVDCEVTSEWQYGSCSVSCAGGKRTLTRDVDVQAGPGPELWQKGHLCPVIQAVQMCNTDRCPVDCELSDWDEWGLCSKVCDGGSRERMRKVRTYKSGAGLPCSFRVESEDCHLQACEQDCVLSDWTEWSTTCSKQCGGGQQTRFKSLVSPASAGGKCAHFYDASRFNTKKCNVDACPFTKKTITCRAKVDIILLIDGSASMGTDGFLAARQFASNFANTLSAPAKLAAMVFSGPDSVPLLNQCEGVAAGGDLSIEQCGMNWISHFDDDFAGVGDKIMAADFPQSSALTSMAIDIAAAEFVYSSPGSQSIAILITDGMPVKKFPMVASVEHIKKTARFMEIVVGRDAYADAAEFKGWGSDPWEQNVRFITEWNDLTSSNETLNAVIEDFCADMVFDKS